MKYMARAGYDPKAAIGLQETFVRLSEGRRDDWLSGLFASHPPSRERVERNQETAAGLPPGGDSGRERYQSRVAYLHRVKPGYAAYDKALKAASQEDYDTARTELDKALAIEPRESNFHALDGDLKAHFDRDRDALTAYDRAVDLNAGFFYPLLRRGALYYDLERHGEARTDLEKSLGLLPTAPAHYLLGNLDRDAGNRDAARQHYEQAAQSDSETGAKAQRELVLMDIGTNPGQYVATAGAADGNGQLYCVIGNRTKVDLTGIRIRARFRDDGGTVRDTAQSYDTVLEGGAQANVPLGWRTANSAGLEQRMECVVSDVRVAD